MTNSSEEEEVVEEVVERLPITRAELDEYWKRNTRLVAILLIIWAIVGYVIPIFLAEPMAAVPFGGNNLGYWVAQQGSEMIFVILIFVYVWRMNQLDREYGVED